MVMSKIFEIIPDDMPEWAREAMEDGQLWNRVFARINELEATANRFPQGYIKPEHAVADAFWKYWEENGETHKHGYYESTWGAINAAINAQ